LRRRDRAGARGPRADAGERRLLGDLAGGLRDDPLARRRGGEEGGGGVQARRGALSGARCDRRRRARAGGRRAKRLRRGREGARRRAARGARRARGRSGRRAAAQATGALPLARRLRVSQLSTPRPQCPQGFPRPFLRFEAGKNRPRTTPRWVEKLVAERNLLLLALGV